MLPYWTVFSIFALSALTNTRYHRSMWWVFGALLVIFVGLRYRVGGDWGTYRGQVWQMIDRDLSGVLGGRDPGYQALNWIAANIGADVWLVNFVCATIIVSGLFRFVRSMPAPMLALTVASPYLIFIVAMGYTRQAAAIGMLLHAFVCFEQRRVPMFIALSVVAATFHQTALLFFGVAALSMVRRNILGFVILMVVGAGMYQLFMAERADRFIAGYVESSYAQASQGGFIRILMTALAGSAFILLSRRMPMEKHVRAFWFWASVMSLVFLALVQISPTAVDRMGLYLLPLQVVVAGYSVAAFPKRSASLVRVGIVGLYTAVLFTWLFFAANRGSWLPYQNWLLVLD